jgi:hypothetical protein
MLGKKRLFKGVLIGIGVFAVVVIGTYLLAPKMFDSMSFVFNVILGVFSENALARAGDFSNSNPFTYRLALYSISFELIKGKVLFGTGQAINEFAYGSFLYSSSLHYSIDNAYLSTLVTNGVFGLLATILEVMCVVSSLIYPYCPNIAADMAKQLSYDINTKYDNITTSNIKSGKLISKDEIHPVFLRVDSELADKAAKK